MHRYMRVGLVGVVLGVFGACGTESNPNASNDTTTTEAATPTSAADGPVVKATEKEFAIALAPPTAAAGEVHFTLHNEGKLDHEFVVFKSDLDPAQLPLNAEGNVDEEGAGVKHIGEQEAIKPGTAPDFAISLDAGNYVVVCNLPGHYKAGMHTALKVT